MGGKTPKITKDEVLARMRAGTSINVIFREAGYKGNSTYYDWRRDDPEFKARADAILEGFTDPRRNQDLHVVGAEREVEVDERASDKPTPYDPATDDWREAFCAEYRRTRSRLGAASLVGKGAGDILNALEPTHDDFDARFSALFEEVRLEEAMAVEDRLIRRAIKDNDRHAIDKVIPHLPRIGEKYGKQAAAEAGGNNPFALILHVRNQDMAIDKVAEAIKEIDITPEIKELAAPATETAN